jgi:hypothetical protein
LNKEVTVRFGKLKNAAVGFDVLTACQPSTVWCSRKDYQRRLLSQPRFVRAVAPRIIIIIIIIITKSVLNDGQAASDKTDPTNILNHRSSDVISSATTVPLTESQTHMAKTIKQTKSTPKWSDIVNGRKDNCCMLNDVPVHSIPTILNGQVSSSVYNEKKGTKWELIKNPFNSVNQSN